MGVGGWMEGEIRRKRANILRKSVKPLYLCSLKFYDPDSDLGYTGVNPE